jgi:hypothetical protein
MTSPFSNARHMASDAFTGRQFKKVPSYSIRASLAGPRLDQRPGDNTTGFTLAEFGSRQTRALSPK